MKKSSFYYKKMSSKILITDLSANLIAFIYQYLDAKDMVNASSANKKMRKALNQDYIYIELTKRDHLFLPSEQDRFDSWKEHWTYLKQLKRNISSGKANIGYKMNPYRGHKTPISALETFNLKKSMDSIIVSGDSSGELLTWNLEEDEDGDKVFNKDLIVKAKSEIIGIKNLNEDSNMVVWTKDNYFYFYSVNMYKNVNKNSERFQLVKEFNIEEYDDPIKQLYYEENSKIIYMSPDLSKICKENNVYSYDLKTFTLRKYKFSYNSSQTNIVSNNGPNNNNQIGWNNYNNNNNLFPVNPLVVNNFHQPNVIPQMFSNRSKRVKKNNSFIVTESSVILYINYEPVKNRPISGYANANALPNIFVFDKNKYIFDYYHIDFDFIFNILPIDNKEVAIIGSKGTDKILLRIYSIQFFTLSREVSLRSSVMNCNDFDVIYYNFPEMYFLVNGKILKKIENLGVKQMKVTDIATLKDVPNITCIEADMFRIVIASDDLFMTIFDIKTGRMWFNLLGGSKSVTTKSFVKHPNFSGFHFIKVTRNAIYSLIGNLIREYKFTFKNAK